MIKGPFPDDSISKLILGLAPRLREYKMTGRLLTRDASWSNVWGSNDLIFWRGDKWSRISKEQESDDSIELLSSADKEEEVTDCPEIWVIKVKKSLDWQWHFAYECFFLWQ